MPGIGRVAFIGNISADIGPAAVDPFTGKLDCGIFHDIKKRMV